MPHTTKIIDLGQIRDIRAEWAKVAHLLSNTKIRGFNLTLLDENGDEAIFLGGTYKADPHEAVKALLRMSAARVLAEDEPPQIKAGVR